MKKASISNLSVALLILVCNILLGFNTKAQDTLSATIYDASNSPFPQSNMNFRGIDVDQNGVVYVGSAGSGTTGYGGFYFDELNQWQSLISTSNFQVRAVCRGRNGIWLGMAKNSVQAISGGGYYFNDPLNQRRWGVNNYSSIIGPIRAGLPSRYVNAIAYDPTYNRTWFANGTDLTTATGQINNGGVAYLDNATGSFTQVVGGYTEQLGYTDTRFLSVAVGSDDVVAFVDKSCNNGVCTSSKIIRYSLNGAYRETFDASNSPIPFSSTSSTFARSMCIDRQNRIWVCWTNSTNTGIAVKDNNGWHSINNANIPFLNAVYFGFSTIKEDGNGNVWFGTNNGLLRFNGDIDVENADNWKMFPIRGLNFPITGLTMGVNNIWVTTLYSVAKVEYPSPFVFTTLNPQTQKEQKLSSLRKLYVSADGSKETTKIYFKASNPNIKVRISSSSNSQSVDNGSLGPLNPIPGTDSFWVYYRHPEEQLGDDFSRNFKLILYNQLNSNEIIYEHDIFIIRPPVMLLHGLWSEGDAFKEMKHAFLQSGFYKDFQVLNPSYPNSVSFKENSDVVPSAFLDLYNQALKNNFSTGKIDAVGHSMGGVLSRLYLQGFYKYDINKLITINTPHSGSPCPNFVKSSIFLRLILSGIGNNTENGALDNLKLDAPEIDETLNLYGRNWHVRPSFTVTSTRETNFTESTLSALINAAFAYKNLFGYFTFSAFANDLFLGDTHDWIVGSLSQKGGLNTSNSRNFIGINHVDVQKDPDVISYVRNLLNKNNDHPLFATDGFNPPDLSPNPSLSRLNFTTQNLSTNATLSISNPVQGSNVTPGQNLSINISGSSDLAHVMVFAGNPNIDMFYADTTESSPQFNYVIPQNAIGTIKIYVLGVDNNGGQVLDSTFVNVSINSSPTSVTIAPVDITIIQGRTRVIDLSSSFADGVTRNIISDNSLSYQFSNSNIAHMTNNNTEIFGDQVGATLLTINYQGVVTHAYVVVIDSTGLNYNPISNTPVIYKNGFPIDRLNVNVCFNEKDTSCFDVGPVGVTKNYSIIQNAAHGNISIINDTQGFCAAYSSETGYSGEDTVKISACMNSGECDTVTIIYNVKEDISGFLINNNNDTLNSSIYGSQYQWFLNAAPITNANLSGIVATNEQSYSVQVVDLDGCVGMSAVYGVLPLNQIILSGKLSDKNGNLKWEVDEDVNIDVYEVEKSTDGISFANIGQVKSLNAGSTYQYSFVDKNLASSNNFYRIKSKSNNGVVKYSNVIVIRFDQLSEFSLLPNPVLDIMNLKFNSPVVQKMTVNIFDANGRRIASTNHTTQKGQNIFSMNLNDLSTGAYYLEVLTSSEKKSFKFIKK
jgi:pimeloyl-ACP methyl ester carboxylesterase